MKNLFFYVVLVVLGLSLFVSSCKEEVPPTVAKIRVVSQNGEVIPYANILLTCTSSVNLPCEIEIEGVADKNGVYERTFDLPKVLHVYAAGNIYDTIITGSLPDTQMVFVKDTVCGNTFISIKPEETSSTTVILYDCK